jgi:tRNA (cytidine/uridine-2'-O-)-methyltransferase
MAIILYQPEIAGNFGNILRSCACFGADLHMIEPTGFPLATKDVRRAAMDYGAAVPLTRHASWSDYAKTRSRKVLFTVRANAPLTDITLLPDDHLIFGRESGGVPDAVHEAADLRVLIPLQPGTRSLNLSNTVAIALFEQLRQGSAL